MTLTKGEIYAWCACGRSKNRPFCDGSHTGTGFEPVVFGAAVELMKVLARACGDEHLSQFEHRDLSTWKEEMAELSGVAFAGVGL